MFKVSCKEDSMPSWRPELTSRRAGVTDSRLTSHGILQIKRLGEHFASQNLQFSAIFSSDLQRAKMTADAIRDAQTKTKVDNPEVVDVIALPLLREQDFGSFECVPWASKAGSGIVYPDPAQQDFKPKETREAMQQRAQEFLDDFLTPFLYLDSVETETIAVVSHGLFLGALWKNLLARMSSNSVTLAPEVRLPGGTRPLEYLPGWSNTGYLELDFYPHREATTVNEVRGNASLARSMLPGWRMKIISVNGKEHLSNLKRTRGGLGNVAYDSRQKNLEGFFKKPKTNDSSG